MTREKCSTKGAKAGCKAKDSWLRLRVLCTLEVGDLQLKKRVWSLLEGLCLQLKDVNSIRRGIRTMGEMWWSPRWFCSKKKHGNYFTAWWANSKHPANTYKIVTALSPSYPSCLGSSDGEPQPDAAKLKEGTLQSMIFCSKSTISRKDMGPV